MPQIVVTIDGRTYRMACAEGEEDHLVGLAADVDARVAELRKSFGEIGDQRLTVMAAIMASDELSEARARVAALEAELEAVNGKRENASRSAASGREVLVETMNGVSEQIERIAARLERGR
ncbi:cell division protein ZapA [Aureimonas populi]|uniref:Cell division protein ZapA n=1 Tax=Aureimonas populi TaxID=1701758 RepID=A0ABW5CHP2_9HYPH|nr:cell division protein ZapA [Aureimonas populi]